MLRGTGSGAVVGVLIALAASAAAPPASAAAGPRVEQMIVFGSGGTLARTVRAAPARVRMTRRKRCAVAGGTPLAALAAAKPGKIGLRDYGSCSRTRARDGSGLFVSSIRGERNRGQDGWVYKVGRRLGTAGAADPAGPFGRGRLRRGQRLVWFYCRYANGSCQRTLEVEASDAGAGVAAVRVLGYDDGGRATAVAGARVTAGAVSTTTAADGRARIALGRGSHVLRAAAAGAIRSFDERVRLR